MAQLADSYQVTKFLLETGVYSLGGEVRLDFEFSAPLSGRATFDDLQHKVKVIGTFELTQKVKTLAYIVKLIFPRAILMTRMPKLNYTVAEVKHLQAAMTYMLLPHEGPPQEVN